MKRPTQKDTNPFKYSDSNKRYRTYDFYMRERFGGKVAKIPLAAGFTCPNIDGTKGTGGCIYCASGSGEFNAPECLPIEEQYRIMLEGMHGKWNTDKTIPYFQVHTNTYAPINVLEELFNKAVKLPGAVGLSVATRADCVSAACANLLSRLGKESYVTVELGLQTAHDKTAELINRCHSYDDFIKGYTLLKEAGNISLCVHLILGLPGETPEMMLETVKKVAELRPDQVKFHLLYVLEGTKLAEMYRNNEYTEFAKEQYISVLADALELLPPETIIGRVTGDAPKDALLSPIWSLRKLAVIDELDKYLYENNMYQGRLYAPNNL